MNQELDTGRLVHFDIEELTKGVYAAIHRRGGWAISNSGIVDLGDHCLVFDTFMTVQAAAELKKVAEDLTGKSVDLVINSHFHNDHIWGNQVFDRETQIISSASTRRLIQSEGQEEYDWYKANSAARLRNLTPEYEEEQEENKKRHLQTSIAYYQAILKTMPYLEIRLPDITFAERLQIHGSNRSIELISFPDGHTGNDTVLYIPSEGILFMSDLLFVDMFPFLADGDPDNLLTILEEVGQMDAPVLVPGHGPVGTQGDLMLMHDYIVECRQSVKTLVEEGRPPEDLRKLPIPQKLSDWDFPQFHSPNLAYYYRKFVDGNS